MPQRQVFTYNPKTGRSEHGYQDLGPGAALPNHGQHTGSNRGAHGAVGLGKFVAPKIPNTNRSI